VESRSLHVPLNLVQDFAKIAAKRSPKLALVDATEESCGANHRDCYGPVPHPCCSRTVDRSDRRWRTEHLKKEKVPWVNLYQDGAGWKHPMAVKYRIHAIPMVVPVDQNGKVVSSRARRRTWQTT